MWKYLSRTWFCCLPIGLFTLLVWGSTLRFDFVWDDGIYITQNEGVRSLANIPGFFYRNDLQSSEKPSLSYRPVRNTVFAVLTALDGKKEPQPWIFHLANVIGHAVAAMLLFTVALLLFERVEGEGSLAARVTALFVAWAFAVHPVLSEVVCWAKCLDDILAAIFVLASARSLLRWREGGRGYVTALLWFALAAFSKESAVPFAAVVIFVLRGFHKLSWRRSATLAIPFFATALFYMVCRHLVIGRTSQCAPLSGTYEQTLIDTIPSATTYLRLLLGMPPFTIDYNYLVGAPPHSFLSGPVLLGFVLMAGLAGLAVWLWRFDGWRVASFGIVWIALFMLPVSNLIPMMQYIAERFLYLPLMGFLLALGAVALHLPFGKMVRRGAFALISVWGICASNRAPVWHDEVTLFVQASLAHPTSWRPHENAIISIFALPQVQPFFRLDPDTHKLIANPPSPTNDAAAMLRTLTQAHDIFPNEHRFAAALGVGYARRGQMTNAISWFEMAAHQTNEAECWIDLGTAYMRVANLSKARDALEAALRISPTNAIARKRLEELNAMKR